MFNKFCGGLVALWNLPGKISRLIDSVSDIRVIVRGVDTKISDIGREKPSSIEDDFGVGGISVVAGGSSRGLPGLIVDFEGDLYYLYGGPYKDKPMGILLGVKMAKEVVRKCFVDIPVVDFSVPNEEVLELNLWKALVGLKANGELYVGCLGVGD